MMIWKEEVERGAAEFGGVYGLEQRGRFMIESKRGEGDKSLAKLFRLSDGRDLSCFRFHGTK